MSVYSGRAARISQLSVGIMIALFCCPSASLAAESRYDVVVYGGTSGGVAAAVQARRMGKTVVLIESGKHLGGLTSGGLGATDIGNKGAIGGLSREFYRRIKAHYDDPQAWRWEEAGKYRGPRQAAGDDAAWTFEPHVAERIMNDLCQEAGVVVVRQKRLDRRQGVVKKEGRIVSIRTEDGHVYLGQCFIDTTYEGDLLALAGVTYHVGREANSQYQETLNGVQTRNAIHHQMVKGVDPYRRPGDPSSGLLPGVHGGPPGEEGSGDRRVQAYNFRMCLTDIPENRIPFAKPDGYDEARYELLLRNFEAGETRTPWSLILMPNRKTDINNNYGFSTDNINLNYDYPDGDDATRDRIFAEHLHYQRGLMWTLANHPRVPEKIRNEVSRWGLCKDEFPDFDGWPHQLYVREARRMVSEYVMTQHHCQGRTLAEDPVGLAAYTMDSHNVQRYVDTNGQVRNEGDVQVGGFPPYPISYRAIRPRREECQNLLVPVCLSASHIAYGSIRMEPVFMVLGQSAAAAACLAIDQGTSVQEIDYQRLRERLLADRQILEWTGPRPARVESLDPAQLDGLVLDDEAIEWVGEWLPSSSVGGFVGARYWHDGAQGQGDKLARFVGMVKEAGNYEVRLYYTANPNRATRVPVIVHHAAGETRVMVNQRKAVKEGYASLGRFDFAAGAARPLVVISNAAADGHVIADAVQLVRRP